MRISFDFFEIIIIFFEKRDYRSHFYTEKTVRFLEVLILNQVLKLYSIYMRDSQQQPGIVRKIFNYKNSTAPYSVINTCSWFINYIYEMVCCCYCFVCHFFLASIFRYLKAFQEICILLLYIRYSCACTQCYSASLWCAFKSCGFRCSSIYFAVVILV